MGGKVHRHHQQNKHQRYRYARQRIQPLIAHQRGDAEQDAEQDHQRNRHRRRQGEDFDQRDGDRRGSPGVPAQLGEAENKIGELAADFTEAKTAHQYGI